MLRNQAGKRNQAGFSLQEALVVVAIGLIVTASGLPRMNNAIGNMKLRSSMTSLSGLLQNARMLAIKQNKTMTALHYNRDTEPRSMVYYVKLATASTDLSTTDAQVELEQPITAYTTPAGTGAPTAITNTALGVTTIPETGNPSFNSRGLPCNYNAGTCTNVSFIQYYKDNRIAGSGGWAAISISPAGRIKRWFWNGSAWLD